MKNKLLLLLLMLVTVSCSTIKYIEKEVPVVQTKTEYKDRMVHDSIYIRDSIYNEKKGDTLYIYKELTKFRYLHSRDTISVIDSIPYPVEVIKTDVVYVNRIYWWQKTAMTMGLVFILYIILLLIIKIKTFKYYD